jgi:hypothetical protein
LTAVGLPACEFGRNFVSTKSRLSTLYRVLALPAVAALWPEPRLHRVHHVWSAGEHTPRTLAPLSQQSRRFLDNRAFLQNRGILNLLHAIESKARLRTTVQRALRGQQQSAITQISTVFAQSA